MSNTSQTDPIVLSLKESSLRMSDVQLLQGPRRVNNRIVSFYCEYLEKVKYKTNPDILFVPPEITHSMILAEEDEMEATLNQLEVPNKPFVFFVLNNNKIPNGSASRWCLLVLSRPEKTFYHFDSEGNDEWKVFSNFFQRIQQILDCHSFTFKHIRGTTPTNTYDCGIHLICMTDNIVDNLHRYETAKGAGHFPQESIRSKRSVLLKLIRSLGGKI